MLLELFEPYLFFISFLATLILNVYLIYKGTVWYNLIIANAILTITMNMLGLGAYDLITVAFTSIIDLIVSLVSSLAGVIGDIIASVVKALLPF